LGGAAGPKPLHLRIVTAAGDRHPGGQHRGRHGNG
jgi:hypothetical protein